MLNIGPNNLSILICIILLQDLFKPICQWYWQTIVFMFAFVSLYISSFSFIVYLAHIVSRICQTTNLMLTRELLRCLGNPLHSTAMEEDLNALEEGRMNKRKAGNKDIPQTSKTTVKQRGAAVKRKETEREEENEKEEEKTKKRSRKSMGGEVKAR